MHTTIHILQTIAQATQAIEINDLPNHAGNDPAQSLVQTAFRIVFGIIGAISFLMIVIAGFRYVLSDGDANAMAKAKGTIIYALVGLAVSFLAFAIVAFVVKGVS